LIIIIQFNKSQLPLFEEKKTTPISKTEELKKTKTKLKKIPSKTRVPKPVYKREIEGEKEIDKDDKFYETKTPPTITPVPRIKDVERKIGSKVIAVIIDDCGLNLEIIETFLELSDEFTFSILPYLNESKKTAQFLHERNCQIMLHLPMEPEDILNNDPGPDALLVNLPKNTIKKRTLQAINFVPYITGVNNHMGSKFTRNTELMQVVLEIIKQNSLFFVDSYTTPNSVAYQISKSMGIITYKRDVFLDNYDALDDFELNLRKLIANAKSKGMAIGICHAKMQTVNNFKKSWHLLEDNNVQLVRLSRFN